MNVANLKLAAAIVTFAISTGSASAFPVQGGYQGLIVPHAPGGPGDQYGYVMQGHGDEGSNFGTNGQGSSSDPGHWAPDAIEDDGPSYLGPHFGGPGSREFFLAFAHHRYCCNQTYDAPVNTTDVGSAAVPEPATLALLGLAMAGLGYSRRRFRR